jgi:hypothetical protein
VGKTGRRMGDSLALGKLGHWTLAGLHYHGHRADPIAGNPLWAAILIIVGIPFQAAGYGTHVSVLQFICFALIFIGSFLPPWRC